MFFLLHGVISNSRFCKFPTSKVGHVGECFIWSEDYLSWIYIYLYICHIRYVSVLLTIWIVDVTLVKTQEKQDGDVLNSRLQGYYFWPCLKMQDMKDHFVDENIYVCCTKDKWVLSQVFIVKMNRAADYSLYSFVPNDLNLGSFWMLFYFIIGVFCMVVLSPMAETPMCIFPQNKRVFWFCFS